MRVRLGGQAGSGSAVRGRVECSRSRLLQGLCHVLTWRHILPALQQVGQEMLVRPCRRTLAAVPWCGRRWGRRWGRRCGRQEGRGREREGRGECEEIGLGLRRGRVRTIEHREEVRQA